ncbi:hypothetical protein HDU93_005891 [Gonapodya sp. JEL0774]|nr:hypothetical protein HDU93_005891 [Gonapodya sp. JEL0774]
MPNLKIALAGNGPLGTILTKALLDSKSFDVTVVGRKAKETTIANVTTKFVPEWNLDGLADAFAGADYVVSALGMSSLASPQFEIIRAAKKAGVKGIVLSEYGAPIKAYPTSPLAGLKIPARALAEEIGLPWIGIINGYFLDYPFFAFIADQQKKEATVFGSPDVKLNFTSREDVGAYLAQILPRFDEFKNGEVQVSAVTTTVRELLTEIGKVQGVQYALNIESLEETKAKAAANPSDQTRFFGIVVAEGFLLNDKDVSSQFPSVKPRGFDYWLPKLYGGKA